MTTTLHTVHGLVPGKRDRAEPAHPERGDVVLPRPTGVWPSAAAGRVRERQWSLPRARVHPPSRPARGRACGVHRVLGARAKAAIVFCDEPVAWGPPPDDLAEVRLARSIAASYGIHLVDWFGCDDEVFVAAGSGSIPIRNGGM